MIQDGQDAEDASRFNAPAYADDHSFDILVDGTTMFVAKAATQSGTALDVDFDWESSDEAVATVMADGAMATITGIRKGESTITVSIAERGVGVEFAVNVHNAVKGILITGTDGAHVVGTSLDDYMAIAYDEANKADGTNDGDEVPNQTFVWSSSSAAATVTGDDDDSSMATVKIAGAGSADITASIGKVTSNKISVSGFSVEEPERRLVVDTTLLPVGGVYDHDPDDNPATSDSTLVAGDGTLQIRVQLQQRAVNADGEMVWNAAANDIAVTFKSLKTGILTLTDAQSSVDTASGDFFAQTGVNGIASITLTVDNVEAVGAANVEIDSEYANPKYVTVTFTAPPAMQ
ncbi:MAG: hypothetical protein F4Z29_01075 [Gemmatimonadetes bacterium]|nr:hypothetical protein [Gemmatimonadota bacterium]